MNYRLFSMRSNRLISDFDFVSEEMSEEQEKICEVCRYRGYRIDLDIKRYTRRRSVEWSEVPSFSCGRDVCLINERAIKNLLNLSSLVKSKIKEEEKWQT